MSSLLEQAIVDASALKDAAMKNAEGLVLEKYSDEVKNALSTLLEQEVEGAEAIAVDSSFIDDVPLAHEDAELDGPQDEEEIEIDLDDIRARLHAEEEEEGIDAGEILDTEETAEDLLATPETTEMPDELAAAAEPAGDLGDELALTEDLLDAVVEQLAVDIEPTLHGWSSLASADTAEHEIETDEIIAAKEAESDEARDELEHNLKLAEDQNKSLDQEITELKSILSEAKVQLSKLILVNTKLVYQNKALNSPSLNERQKEKIVDAVRNAKSLEEVKVLYDAFQSTVRPTRGYRNNSLSEAVSRPTTSMLLGTRRSQSSAPAEDPNMQRMLRLAGLKS